VTDPHAVLAGLNPEQREAATAIHGPVAILAGAGTGKTTTITHRIAYQVATGAFRPEQLLAVTFTEKAAGELKARLAALGVPGVEARTFHAAALSQLGRLWKLHTGSDLPEILDSKARVLSSLANALPAPHRFVPRRELAAEIEWAKVRTVPPDRYLQEVERIGRTPPIPAELMLRVYQGYERRKSAMGRLDFEDMLGLAVRLFDERPAALHDVRERFAAFTVDEYQDVNPLQVDLLERWLGDRDELCVVGDDYQTIYAFAGASPSHLLRFAQRFPSARMIRLERNYRSTPQVLAAANRLAPALGGFPKILRPTRGDGPGPVTRAFPDGAAEVGFVVGEARRLHRDEGVPLERIAVIYRINARSEDFEEAFAAAGMPYQVKDGSFLGRPGPKAALARLRRAEGDVVAAVETVIAALGFDPELQADSAEEATRQADLARLRSLAQEFEAVHPGGGSGAFQEELRRRFSAEAFGRGVNLLTYHRAKGLEFEAVFLPRLLDRELPFRSGRVASDVSEERRLLYVGITRARSHLFLTWPLDARARRSPFLDEMFPPPATPPGRRHEAAIELSGGTAEDEGLLDALKRWRRQRAKAERTMSYIVFQDATLDAIARSRPGTLDELLAVSGVGPTKLRRYGDEVLAIVRDAQGRATASSRRRDASATSSTAESKASAFARDGLR